MLKTAKMFSDHMVLQRNKPIPVWGEAAPGAPVTVELDGSRVQAQANENGHWLAYLPEREAGVGLCLQVRNGQEQQTFHDVCVGEVWLAGGQSNMEYLLGFEKHIDEVLAGKMNPEIRFFNYPQVTYEGQLEDYNYCNDGFWRCCTKAALPYFSAVGYYFALDVQKALDVPVGIIGCNWGGTPACAWMDNRYLEDTDGAVWLREYEEATRDLDLEAYQAAFRANPNNDRTHMLENPFNIKVVKEGLTRQEQLQLVSLIPQQPEPYGPWYERRPGGLYETMLKKVHPYAIKGVIWYQGESDDKHPEKYKTVFSRMIRCWRDLWQEELPFLFVQLAPFRQWLLCYGDQYPTVRESQQWVSKEVPNTWMASIGDAGMQWDIHPKDKLPVGHRLALLARGHVYGEPILCDAPELESAQKQGGQILLRFAHAAGLHKTCDALQAMVGIDASGESREITTARIENDTLILPDCEDICALAFARTGYYEVNLYNAAGIPAKPFEVEL